MSIYGLTVSGRRMSHTAFGHATLEEQRELGTPALNPRSRLRENERFGGLPCDEVPLAWWQDLQPHTCSKFKDIDSRVTHC